MTPTARTLQYLRKRGITADVVERWIAGAGVRKDFLGIIDLIYLHKGRIYGVQCTTGSNHAARQKKAEREPRLLEWDRCEANFEVWSWDKQGARGKRKTWCLRRALWVHADIWVTPCDLPAPNTKKRKAKR